MSDSLIPSFLVGDVSSGLTKNEQCEQIAQGSPKMSDVSKSLMLVTKNERFGQVAHQKWGTMSKSLRLLTKNEQMSQ